MKNPKIENQNPEIENPEIITKITKSEKSKSGYQIEFDGKIFQLNDYPKNEENITLILPENPSNRKFIRISKIEKSNLPLILNYKDSIKLSDYPKSEKSKSKKFNPEDFLNDDEKIQYQELMKISRERYEKSLIKSPEEKLREKIAKLEEELKNLQK